MKTKFHYLGVFQTKNALFINYFTLTVAAVCRKAGERLVIEEIMVSPPMAGEVRIKIICTSLCHSDITFWKMKVVVAKSHISFSIFLIVLVLKI